MRSVMLVTLVLGCGVAAMGATVSQPPDAAPGCLTMPADDASLQNCAGIDLGNAARLSRTLQGYNSDTGSVFDLAMIPRDRSLQNADQASAKPWIRGPEPRTALLAVSGFAWIGLLIRRRRRPGARHRSRRRRLVYTMRQMA
jgi:hypothetical protein